MRDHNEIVFDDQTGDVVSIETTSPTPEVKDTSDEQKTERPREILTRAL